MTAPQKLATTGIIALLLGGALVSASPLVATAEDLPERAPTDAPAPDPAPNTTVDEKKQCPWLPEDPTGRFENGKLVIEWTVPEPNPYESFVVGYPGTPVDRDARSWVDPIDYRPGVKIRPMVSAICDGSLPRGDIGRSSINSGQPVLIPGGPEIPAEISSMAVGHSDAGGDASAIAGSHAAGWGEALAETGTGTETDGTASAAASAGSAGSADDAATTASGTSAETDSSAGTGADADGGRPAADTHSSAETETATHTATALESAHADATSAGHETEAPTPTTAITEAGAPKQLAETGGQGSSPLLTGIGAAFAALGGTLVAAAARRRRLDREAS